VGVELSAVTVCHAMAQYDAVIRVSGDMARRVFSGEYMDPASPAKSALFLRLLMGKPALRHAPPTAFSYPHYALIEESALLAWSCGAWSHSADSPSGLGVRMENTGSP